MRKIISKYIFKETSGVFFIILFVLTFVLVMGNILQIMDLYVNKGIRFFSILKLFLYLLPSLLVFTVPISLLIAVLIAMGRFSADNEHTALRSSGLSLLQIYYPIGVASLIAFIFTFVFSYYLVPHSYASTKQVLFEIALQNASVGIKEKVFNDDFKDLLLYADRISSDSHYMEGVLVSDNRIADQPNTILARRASLISNRKLRIIKISLEDGSIHTVTPDFKNYRRIDFDRYDINLDLSQIINTARYASKTKDEMSLKELIQKAKATDIQDANRREMLIEANKRFAVPVSCLIFGIIALPLGIRSHRAVKSRGFAIGILVASSYFLLRLGGEAFGETGHISPALGVWGPNFLFALLGIMLFGLAYKEINPWATFRRRLRRFFKQKRMAN